MRIRAVAIVLDANDVLLIERKNGGRTYSVLPGGAVEPGESIVDACLRELREETGLRGRDPELIDVAVDLETPAFYFRVRVDSREVRLGEPEASRAVEANSYAPTWVPVTETERHNLVPDLARAAVEATVLLGDAVEPG